MPIYEYLCPACNRVYSFFTQSVSGDKEPLCPKCGATELEKQVSRFAFVRGGSAARAKGEAVGGLGGESGDLGPGGGPDFDDPKVEREMMRLMRDMEHIDESDPRQLGRLMRRMSDLSGEGMDAEFEEAVRRLEAGEDPEKIEADMGDLFGGDDPDGMGGMGGFGGRGAPTYDDGLYSL